MKARPTKITKLDKLDNYGNTTFVIEFDDGTKGFYTSKSPDQIKFTVGNVADFEIEAKQGSKGPYNKITIPQTGFKPGAGKPTIEPRIQMISFAAAYTKDLVVAGKFGMEKYEQEFNRIYDVMISKL